MSSRETARRSAGIDGDRIVCGKDSRKHGQATCETTRTRLAIASARCATNLHPPATVLRELRRVVKPAGRGRIMVYNRHSVWFQLFVPYILQVRAGKHSELSVEDAFERTTDGEDCPISRAYAPDAFVAMCRDAGFEATFVGGYFHRFELRWMRHARRALADERLPPEHRDFITALERDGRGRPTYGGHHAGVGGCYTVTPA